VKPALPGSCQPALRPRPGRRKTLSADITGKLSNSPGEVNIRSNRLKDPAGLADDFIETVFALLEEAALGACLLRRSSRGEPRIVRVNQSFCLLSGLSLEELKDSPLSALLPPEDAARVLGQRRKGPPEKGAGTVFRTFLIRPGRDDLPVEIRHFRMKAVPAGSLLLLVRDLSAPQRLESQVQAQQRTIRLLGSLNSLLYHSGDLDWTLDISLSSTLNLSGMETCGFYLNRSGSLRLALSRGREGYLPRTLPRRPFASCTETLVRPEEAGPGRRTGTIAGILLKNEPRLKSILTVPLAGESGELLGLLLAASRKSVRPGPETLEILTSLGRQISRVLYSALIIERLAGSEARYRAILNGVADGFVLFKGDRVVEMNPAFENILSQYTAHPEEITPRTLYPDRRTRAVQVRSGNWEKELACPDGQPRWLNVSRSTLDLPEKFSAFFVRDITERKQWEMFKILSERLAASGTLAAGLAHEINNPLQAVLINLGLLARRLGPDPRQQDLLNGIHAGLNSIRETVVQLQEIHRAERFPRRSIQINEVLQNTLSLAVGFLEKNGIALQLSLASNLPLTRGSGALLQRAFLNFVLNACEAMPDGGTLHVHTYLHRGAVYVRFTDTGVGIDPEKQSQIFDVYYSTKTRPRGRGLGLTIALNLVRQHHGEIYIKSRPGNGSSFTIKIPVRG
jgi:PAS domain S-box-containing protein